MSETILAFALAACLVALGFFLRGRSRKRIVRFQWTVGPVTTKKGKAEQMIEVRLTNEQKVRVSLTPVTGTGKPAAIDGKPSWTVSSGDSTVEVAEDGLSAMLVSSDTPGETMVVVEADADLGDGVENISDAIKLTVEGAKAVSLGLSIGTPEPK